MTKLNTNLMLVTLGCFLTYAVLSGLLSQIGTLSAAMATHFDKPLTETATRFSYFSTGISIGSLLSLIAYEYLSIKRAFILCYVIFASCMLLITQLDNWSSLIYLLLLAGIAGSLGLNTAAVTISINYQQQTRAAMLLTTDICFASAGIIASPMAVMLLAQGLPWHSSLWLLAGVSVVIIMIASVATYPPTAKQSASSNVKSNLQAPVLLCAVGLFCYIFAQITMLLWLPNYLNTLATPFGTTSTDLALGANAVSRYWTGMVIGQLVLVFLLRKISAAQLLRVIVVGSVVVSTVLWLAGQPSSISLAAFCLGLVNAGVLKLTLAYASNLVIHPQRVVTFLLFSAAVGQALAPSISAQLVNLFGMHFGLQLISIFTLLAAICICAATLFNRYTKESPSHDTSSATS